MRTTVRMYAVLKDYFGESLQLDLEGGATIADIKESLAQKNPESSFILDKCRFAVNQEMAACAHIINNGDLIDVLPPSSGG